MTQLQIPNQAQPVIKNVPASIMDRVWWRFLQGIATIGGNILIQSYDNGGGDTGTEILDANGVVLAQFGDQGYVTLTSDTGFQYFLINTFAASINFPGGAGFSVNETSFEFTDSVINYVNGNSSSGLQVYNGIEVIHADNSLIFSANNSDIRVDTAILPTTDPHVLGQLYQVGGSIVGPTPGTLMVSFG